MENKTYTITKRIAKHGNQSIIIIPKVLQESLKPKTIVEVQINVLGEEKNETE